MYATRKGVARGVSRRTLRRRCEEGAESLGLWGRPPTPLREIRTFRLSSLDNRHPPIRNASLHDDKINPRPDAFSRDDLRDMIIIADSDTKHIRALSPDRSFIQRKLPRKHFHSSLQGSKRKALNHLNILGHACPATRFCAGSSKTSGHVIHQVR